MRLSFIAKLPLVGCLLLAPVAHAGGPVPPNDDCFNATVIPGNVVTYNPATYDTTGATQEACAANESCEAGGAGSSNSVWYVYSPDNSGQIEINTFGSTYNTILSIWAGCPAGNPPLCLLTTQLACNDDTVGTLSQLFFNVVAGATYRIKVADYNAADGGGMLNFNLFWSPNNDTCANATHVNSKEYNPPTYNTANAGDDICEPLESCEVNGVGTSNSVWYRFCSLENGTMTVHTTGSSYDTVLSIWDGCGEGPFDGCTFPSELACDDDSGPGTTSQIADFPVVAGLDYFIKVSDYNLTQAGGSLSFHLSFSEECAGDITNNGQTDVDDLLLLINGWGTCP